MEEELVVDTAVALAALRAAGGLPEAPPPPAAGSAAEAVGLAPSLVEFVFTGEESAVAPGGCVLAEAYDPAADGEEEEEQKAAPPASCFSLVWGC